MRIALCLSGQPRGIETNCDHIIEYLIKPNKIQDIFIHTWYDASCINAPMLGNNFNNGNFKPDCDKILIETFNPKKLICEPPKSFSEFSHLKGTLTDQTHIASQFYSIMMSNKIKQDYEKENAFEFDIVIKARLDLEFHKKPIIETMLNDSNANENANAIYNSSFYQNNSAHQAINVTKSGKNYIPMSDCMFFGLSKNMDKVMVNMYENFEAIHSDLGSCNSAEGFLSYSTTINNPFKIIPKDFSYLIK